MSDDLTQRRKELLRQRLAAGGLSGAGADTLIAARPDGATSPLAAAQRRLWFVSHRDSADTSLNVGVAHRLVGPLDAQRLRAAFTSVVERHEILRTTYELGDDGEPLARHHTAATISWRTDDVGDLTGARRDRRLKVLAQREFGTPFDLTAEPPIRVLLVAAGVDDHVLLLTVHHICWDDESWPVLFAEVNQAYNAVGDSTGETGGPEPLPRQYVDLPGADSATVAADLEYWRAQLTPIPEPVGLPASLSSRAGKRQSALLTRPLTEALRAKVDNAARAAAVSPFTVHAAALDALIHRLTGATDFTIAVPVTHRPAHAAALIGYFGNTLLTRTRPAGDDTFAQLVASAGQRLVDGLAHQTAPIDAVVGALNPQRSAGGDGLERLVEISLSARGDAHGFALRDVTSEPLDGLSTPNGQLPLEFSIVTDDQPSLELEYDTDRFGDTLAADIADGYLLLLERMLDEPHRAIRDHDLLAPATRDRVLAASAGHQAPVAASTVVDLFAAAVAARPDHEAVVSDDITLSYRALDERSNRLAHWLISSGAGPDDLIGLRLGASVGFVVAALAVLKSGAAYLPIDPDYPADRADFLISDAGPRLVLDADSLAAVEAEAAAGTEFPSAAAPTDADRREPLRPTNLAYVIYTSGSTGTPKGVAVAHDAIADHLNGFGAGEVLDADDRLVQTSSVSFDASMFEIFCTLAMGATLVVPKPGAVHDIAYMADLLVRQRVTVMHMVPTLLSTLLMVPEVKQWTMLRTVPVGGEAFPGEVADAFTTAFDAALSNNYGPTEAVVAATHYPITTPQGNAVVPIGTPNTNVTAYLLDPGLQLLPDGMVGEIYLGGPQLARGYLGRPTLTATRFIADPFTPGGRLYRTGDLARRNTDGDLEFVGRADEQVKVRGFRIELGEVEAGLADHPDVAHALVVVDSDDAGARLLAYVIPAAHVGADLDLDAVLSHARIRLPDYMVPSAVAVIDEVPLTTHGKLDRDALPIISARPRDDRAPQTPTEKRIAAVYGELFGSDDISAGSSFFDLGGHSLLAARLVTTLTTEFGIDVDVRLPLDNPTVAGLAAAVNAAVRDEFGIDLDELGDLDDLGDFDDADTLDGIAAPATPSAPARPPLRHVDAPEPLPLSFSQLAMWFQHRFEGPGAAGNIPLAMRLDGPIDTTALRVALTDVVGHHSALRTTFVERDGLPTARITDAAHVDVPIVDVDDPGATTEHLARARDHVFDLAEGPLLNATLLRENDIRHTLSLVVHHMVIDHWSTDVLIDDLITAYRARAAGAVPALSPGHGISSELTYTDYALWQHQVFPVGIDRPSAPVTGSSDTDDPDSMGSADAAAAFGRRQIERWRSVLDGQPDEITVATDHPRPSALGKVGVLADLTVPAETHRRLRRVADDCGATEFMMVTAALTALWSRLGGGDDIAIGTPVAGRVDPGTERVVGLFANMVALRTRTDGSPTVRDLVRRCRDTVLDAFAHQDVPIERLVEALNPRRTRSRNPLFQSMIHFRDRDQNTAGRPLDDAGSTIALLPVEQDTSFLDLNVILAVNADGGLDGRVVGSADLYEQSTIDGIAAALGAMLAAFATDADTAVDAIVVPPLPGVVTADMHGEDPAELAAIITRHRPHRVHAAPRTLAALQHTGSTDLGSVREWVATDAGAGTSLGESLAALAPGSRFTDPFDSAPTPVVMAMAAAAGGGAQTPTEERLIAILSDLLGIDGLGRDDNFFAVGGDSVISIQWSARAAAEGLPLAPQQIFDHYSIAELAAAVDEERSRPLDEHSDEQGQADAAPMSASGLSDDMLQSLGAAWKSHQ
ncbi:amino acid adenylation domain-containing protein [Gordonia sp. HNM0687]|uniref:Amino acid adenylation domain-containing protein n=1 Tax=Gordonia mangrovi TaxID=2665643 RepID=A0A6L7GRJ5_9ACTN|nr:non-ribosomal peptide synthetase [Gordonia mangrovi]MXP22007.1 amino acid adenylation domain-containing protein [Gordonia mangrovi]UVF76361.1 non-ribosomal peptide synthetase [Gordonia mangrovi]